MNTPTLYLIRGLPGSGKSTWAKQIVENCPATVHYEADMYHIDNQGKYNWEPKNVPLAHQWCQNSTIEALKKGFNVVVSNTFTTVKELRPYFEMTKELGIGAPVVLDCLGNYGSIHNVPDAVMKAMAERFQYDISELFHC